MQTYLSVSVFFHLDVLCIRLHKLSNFFFGLVHFSTNAKIHAIHQIQNYWSFQIQFLNVHSDTFQVLLSKWMLIMPSVELLLSVMYSVKLTSDEHFNHDRLNHKYMEKKRSPIVISYMHNYTKRKTRSFCIFVKNNAFTTEHSSTALPFHSLFMWLCVSFFLVFVLLFVVTRASIYFFCSINFCMFLHSTAYQQTFHIVLIIRIVHVI